MSTIVGEVSKLEGIVRAINPVTGEVRVLEKGSPVFAGEIIQTSGKGGVVVDMTNGTLLTLGRDTQMRLDDDVSGKASTVDSGTEGAVDIAALQQAVLEGNFDELEATAAGEAFVTGSASDGGVFVERLGLEGQVTSGFDTATTTQTFNEGSRFVGTNITPLEENDITPPPEDDDVAFTFQLFGLDGSGNYVSANSINEEGETSAEYVVLAVDGTGTPLTTQPTGTVDVSFTNNGTTSAGDYTTSGTVATISTAFSSTAVDDAFADNGETFTVALEGNYSDAAAYEAINYNADTVTTTIVDETSTTPPEDDDVAFTFQLFGLDGSGNYVSANSINEEGETSAEYVVLAVDGTGTPLTTQPTGTVDVSFTNNGTTSAGDYTTSGTVATIGTAFSSTAVDDAFADNGETFTVALEGNYSDAAAYEAINYNADTVTTTIVDVDSMTVTVGNATVNEDATSATVSVTLAGYDFSTGETVTVTLDDGSTVDFTSNGSQNATYAITPDSDSLVEADATTAITATVASDAGTIENPSVMAGSLTVSDSIDAPSVTIGNATVNEDATSATVSVTLAGYDFSTGETVTVTLDDGSTVNFTSNGSQNATYAVTPDSDSLVEADATTAITATVASDAGTIENPSVTAGSLTVSDTVDATTLTLNDVSVNEGTGQATITASLDHTPETELVVTLDNGATVTFGTDYVAGTDVSSTPFNINNGEDVYVDGSSFDVAVASTTGGNFENLVTTDTATVTVSDTVDATTLTLNDVSVNEGTGQATITASLDHTPETELVVTLDNGATVTFGTDYVAGTDVSSTPFNINNGEDVYVDGSSFDVAVASTTGGNFENLVTTDTATVTVSDTVDATTLTLNDVSVNEGTGQATITASLDHTPETELVVTLDNGATVTFGTDYVAGTDVSSTPFNINNGEDVYVDGSSFDVAVASTTGGNFENLVTTDTATVTVSDTVDATTLTLNDVSVNEGTGQATITASLDHTPETELVVTLDNGATVTFGTDYVAGTDVSSTPFNINNGEDVYVDGSSFDVAVASTTGGNFENLVTTDTATVTVSDTVDATTLTLNDVSVNEGTGQATITASLDHTPETELVVTLDNGATVTFGTDYVAGTDVSSTPFNINNGEDVYVDGSSFDVAVASTTGGNFENLVTTDTATVTVSDTVDATTLTLNDVSVNEGTGQATITASLDHTPETELVVTLDNGATVTFGTDYVAGTDVSSTPFNINNGEDVYVDGSSFDVAVASTTGGNFENLVTTDTATVTVSDTVDATTLTLNDVSVNEGTGQATITASLDHTPETELVVTLDNGATVTFGTDYVAGTDVSSTPFNINNGEDVYVDGSSFDVAVASTTGGNFENLVTTDTATVTVSDTVDATTLTLNDVSVNEGTGQATITASLDHTPETELVVTLDNGATVTFGTDYVAGTDVSSTPFNINNGEDVYVDGSSFDVAVASTTGGNFENLVTTDTATVTVSDTVDATTLTLNDVSVNEGTGQATITASLDHTPETELVVTLDNGATVTFGTDYVAGTDVSSTPFNINNGEDVYVDGSSFDVAVASTTGGNFENLVTTDTATVTVSDTVDATTLTLNDVSVNEGTGQATITASLDHTPETELVVTLDNGATVTFGTDYVAGTDVSSTPFNINNGEDVYVDGSSFDVAVASTTGGNFENLVTTDTATVTVSDTVDATTLTLNDVSVNEGTGQATITASLDHTPETELVVTLDNGATVTFGTDYVAGTDVSSTPFNINNGEDVYVDGSSFDVAVASTTGGNFENLVTTDTATVTVSDTVDATTLTLNDVSVNEGTGQATITASLDHTPETELVVTLDNGATVTFGTDYVAGTDVSSTPFNINNGEDVYVDGSSFDVAVASTTGGNFENLVTTDTATVTVSDTVDATTLTLNDVSVNEGTGQATITASLDHTPETELVVTLDNGATVTFGTDYVAGTDVSSTPFNINNGEDVYVDGSSFDVAVASTTGGNFENLVTTDTATVTVSDTVDATTLTLNDVSVNEGTGQATITASLDHTPETELVVTLDNGATVTFGTDYVAGTDVSSTPFNINNGEDVYVDGSSFDVAVASTTGGNFENLVTTDTATVTVSDTVDATTLTLNDVSVNEGTGQATITASLDHTPETELVVTLDNGATVTFGTDYVAGTDVSSTPFNINNGEDVYVDGSSFDVAVASTTGGNFENLVTTDTATVTVSDTVDATTLTLNDVSVNEGTGQATITASLDHTPETELVVTLDNGATVTFGTDYVAGTDVSSTPFNINNGEDVYVDGSSFDVAVASTTGGNFENLVTTDTATVTVSDTVDATTLTLNDVSVNEGTGQATITASLDHTPETELVVTLDNGATVTFGTDYVAGTDVSSTPFNINNGEDVYVDGSSFDVAVASTTGGNFENLVTTDTATVTVSDTVDATTLTLNDVSVNEGTGQATITASLDHTPETELVVTLDNGATVTFGTDYVAGTDVSSTPFNINNGEDVYVDGSSFDVAVASTTGGNFENLVTTDTATVTVSDTVDATTLTLNDVSVNEGTGQATITASLDHTPETELVVTLDNGATVTFGTDYVAGTDVSSTPFNINNGEDVYVDGSSFDVAVASTTGGNFENLVTTDTATVTVSDTVDATTLTLNDVSVNEGTGQATITASLDHTPETELVNVGQWRDSDLRHRLCGRYRREFNTVQHQQW
ncbi:immunoglobulin-like domain-containing protein [Thiomicrorhabdus lithotrophica]|uniref:LapA adhesin domain-containing protein n=1 Tax=Thiomicrorhabdus lithotrophica TaxID=2949997 RepID=A0ABY8C9Y3_9GAMM|nr:immunoglobulin-like domain-containing protein [Thiomicrorhabdus lithotrophica]WEJ62781.1 hypothetical protein NR989_00620 [Thiomicrorhabdus lithotrophica]